MAILPCITGASVVQQVACLDLSHNFRSIPELQIDMSTQKSGGALAVEGNGADLDAKFVAE